MLNNLTKIAPWFAGIIGILLLWPNISNMLTPFLQKIGMKKDISDYELEIQAEIANNPSIAMGVGGSIPTAAKIMKDAKDIAYELGVEPWAMTEDEEAAIAIILPYSPDSFELVEDAYAVLTGNELADDLKRLLNSEQYNLIEHLLDE